MRGMQKAESESERKSWFGGWLGRGSVCSLAEEVLDELAGDAAGKKSWDWDPHECRSTYHSPWNTVKFNRGS